MLVLLTLVGLAAWRRISATSASTWCWVRLALSAALAASLVPSRATVPTRTMPAAAHSLSEATKNPASGVSWRARNRAMVTWSGSRLPAST